MLFKQPRVTIPVAHQSASGEWWTPAPYADMARAVMGRIDLDPASCAEANLNIRATQYFDIAMNGLTQSWFGCIWLNPPYTREGTQRHFVKKLFEEWNAGCIEQAIVLLNANSIGSSWFDPLEAFPTCIKRSPRIRFIPATERQIENPKRPGNDNVFVYLGPNVGAFIKIFEAIGRLYLPANRQCPQCGATRR
jgi:ParB family transcriptional regulator, chromosome partitioning protein